MRFSRCALVAGMLLYSCFAATQVSRPPLGRDGWREADGLIVARNFAREALPVWQPRIDTGGPQSQPAGMEFPLINYIGGRLADHGINLEAATRSTTVIFTMLAAYSLFVWARAQGVPAAHGALAALAFLVSPLVLRYGQAAQPDMPALAMALAALALLTRATGAASCFGFWPTYYLSALCMALGIAMKLPVIVFGLPALVWLLPSLRQAKWRIFAYAGYVPVALAWPALWYRHARQVQWAQNNAYFNIHRGLGEIVADISQPGLYGRLSAQLWDIQAGPLLALMILSALCGRRRLGPATWAMVMATVVGLLLAGRLGTHHLYYGLPVTATLCTLLGCVPAALPKPRTLAACALLLTTWGLWRTRHWIPPRVLAIEYVTARKQLAAIAGPVQLMSHGDPTLLYLVDRRGWVDDRVRPEAAAHLVDLRRVRGAELAHVERRLRASGCALLHADALTQVWLAGPKQG